MPWKLLRSEIVFDEFLQIKKDIYEAPNGKQQAYRYVSNLDTVCVLAQTPEKKFVLIELFRPSAAGIVLDIPGGIVEKGEEPEAAAHRELTEETGYVAEQLVHLGTFYLSPGGAASVVHLYFANVGMQGKSSPDPFEFIDVKHKTHEELRQIIEHGTPRVRLALPLAFFLAGQRGLLCE